MEFNDITEDVTASVVKEDVSSKLHETFVNTVFNEKTSTMPEGETIDTAIKRKNMLSKVVKQLGYYFSDTNLPYDKFLQKEIQSDDGWVKISVLLTFKRLAAITENPAIIAAAVKSDTDSILEVDETNEKIRRKPDYVLPIANKDFLNELIERSIYCKGFPKTSTMDELLEFSASLGEKVITKVTPRRTKTAQFKGSIYLTFNTKELAEKFLKQESVKFKHFELERMWEKDFLDQKNKEYKGWREKKIKKIQAETEKYFKKGYLIKADNINANITVDSIKAVCSGFNWQVAFVKIVKVQDIAWIRLKPFKAAKDLLQEINGKPNDLNIVFSVPNEEVEQTVLNEMTSELKAVYNMKDKMKKGNKKGVKRGDNKRSNEGSHHSSNKKLKNK